MKYHITETYCKGNGIEIGRAANNDYELDCINVGLSIPLFEEHQVSLGFTPSKIDIDAYADDIPLESNTLDFIFSSHVIEHMANLYKSVQEWCRLLRVGGYLVTICPQPNAIDGHRELTHWKEIEHDKEMGHTPESKTKETGASLFGHYYVFRPLTLNNYILRCSEGMLVNILTEDPDKRFGNGFTLVHQKIER
jgi:SAM-dependent methyltransferase